ncbi:protein slit-like protein, partial [Dinothrombium tinctorium]
MNCQKRREESRDDENDGGFEFFAKSEKKSVAVVANSRTTTTNTAKVGRRDKCFEDCVCIESTIYSLNDGLESSVELSCNLSQSKQQRFIDAIKAYSEQRNHINFNLTVINNGLDSSSSIVSNALKSLSSKAKSKLSKLTLSRLDLRVFPFETISDYSNLQTLDLSFNALTLIPPVFSLSLKHLNLSHNRLSQIHHFKHHFPNFKTLDISNNEVVFLSPSVFTNDYSQNVTIYLANNPWHCEEHLIQLFETYLYNIADKSKINCSSPWQMNGMNLTQIQSVRETDTCKKCDCFLATDQKLMTVNCTDTEMKSLPINLPIDTIFVNLTNNQIKYLTLPVTATDWRK